MKEKINQFLEYEIVKKIIYAIRFFTTKRIINAASALTYSTILSLVPICAVVFAIARGFGYTKYIEEWFRNLLASQPQASDFIISFVNSYLEHTKSGIILGIGLVFMLYTVVSLTRGVEQTFNDIWHVENRRNIMRTFTDYIAIFFLIPILVIIMSGLSLFISTLAAHTEWEDLLGPVMQFFVDLIPFLLMWGAFTALYVFMPNTRVKWKSSLVPGMLAAVAMWLLQWFYINAQMFISNYNAIYGSFAALPLFMLWVQLSWTICLFGAELSYTNQNLEESMFIKGATLMSHRDMIVLSLVLMNKICKRFDKGEKPYTAVELKEETSIPLSITRDLLYMLAGANLLIENIGDKHVEESRFLPALSLDKITAGKVIESLEAKGIWEMNLDIKQHLNDIDSWKTIRNSRHNYISEMSQVQLKDL